MALRCTRRERWRVGGLAVVAMLLLALAPALSRMQAAADPLAWVQVCTAGGLVQAQTQPDGEPMPNPAEHLRLGHGATASLQAHAHALPTADVVLAQPNRPGHEPPVGQPEAAAQAPLWRQAQARAPPWV